MKIEQVRQAYQSMKDKYCQYDRHNLKGELQTLDQFITEIELTRKANDYFKDKSIPFQKLYEFCETNKDLKDQVDNLYRYVQNLQDKNFIQEITLEHICDLISKKQINYNDFLYNGKMESPEDIRNDLESQAKEDYAKSEGYKGWEE